MAVDDVDAIVSALRGSQDWRPVLKQVDAWCRAPSRFPAVRQLHEKLVTMPDDPAEPSFRSARDHVESMVTLHDGEEHVELAWELWRARRAAGGTKSHIPAMLAQAHAWPRIRKLLLAHREDAHFVETAAEVIVECGLRQHPVAGDSVVVSVWAALEARGNPLAWLPPERRPLEGEVRYTNFVVDGQSWTNPDPKPLSAAPDGATPELSVEELTPVDRKAIDGAFDGFCTRSNGRLALREFSARAELDVTRGLVRALATDFEPLAGAIAKGAGPIRAESAVAAVLSVPIFGGAYAGALGGCFGRLAGWHALRAIAGAEPLDSFASVERRVGASEWLCIEPTSAWFEGIMLDYFLVCLHPGKKRGLAIAWTDTD